MSKWPRCFLTAACLIWLAGCAAVNQWQSVEPGPEMRRVGWSEEYRKQTQGRLLLLTLTDDGHAIRLECRENVFATDADFLYATFNSLTTTDVNFYFCHNYELVFPQEQEMRTKWRQSSLSRLGDEELEGLPEPVKEKAKAVLRFAASRFVSYP